MYVHWEVITRSTFAYIALWALCRLVGKAFSVVLPVSFGVIAAVVSVDRSVSVADGVIALIVWGVLTAIFGFLSMKSKQAQNVLMGKPTVLIEGGNVIGQNLVKSRMTINDILGRLRQKDAFKVADVEFAVLETDGQVSVMKKSDVQPLTPKAAGVAVQNETAPVVVIEDGVVSYNTLLDKGYSEGKLLADIMRQGARTDDDVFLAQLDSSDNLYVDLKKDVFKQSPDNVNNKAKLLLLASLKKLQSDLESFALQTDNLQAKTAYQEEAELLARIIAQVQPQLVKESKFGAS